MAASAEESARCSAWNDAADASPGRPRVRHAIAHEQGQQSAAGGLEPWVRGDGVAGVPQIS